MKLQFEADLSESAINEVMQSIVKDKIRTEMNGYLFNGQVKSIIKLHIDKHLDQMIRDEMQASERLKAEIREAIKKELARRIKAVIALEEDAK